MEYSPNTVALLFDKNLDKNVSGIACVTKRNGHWNAVTVQDFRTKVRHLALAMHSLGVKKGDAVSIHSPNSSEWLLCDQAILSMGAVNVAIYTTQPVDQIVYILNDSKSVFHFVSDQTMFEALKPRMNEAESVGHVVFMESNEFPKAGTSLQEQSDDQVKAPVYYTFEDLLAMGADYERHHPDLFEQLRNQVAANDLANINYTSGTTGVPKGVMLSHYNLVTNTIASLERLPFSPTETASNVLSYLPLAHMLERIGAYLYTGAGATIYYIDDLQDIREDMQHVKPIFFATVPRLLEKIHTGLKAKGQELSGAKKRLYYWALHRAEQFDPERPPRGFAKQQWKIADALVYKKIREGLGGTIQGTMSGGAALHPTVMRFFNGIGIKCGIGYGLTETSPVLTASMPDCIRIGSAGKPLQDVSIRIAEDGEVQAQGPNIMQGYYGLPELTKEVMTDDGWFCTGDIGYIDEDGWLFITDRKKALFKLSTGKYVAPQPIENGLTASPYIDQAVVIGAEKKFVAALMYPDWARIEQRLAQKGISFDQKDRAADPAVVELLEAEIDKVNSPLPAWEQIKKFVCLQEALTIEKGELTPKMSIKREVVTGNYESLINSLYEE
jgi:long-chain acyl-CoA synthetase